MTQFGATSTAGEVLAGVDLSGKTAVVTGAGSGIGKVTAEALARAGAAVVAGVRDPAAAELPGVQVRRLDLSDQGSVAEFAAGCGTTDIVIANAGVMGCPETRVGPDGWELQFAVNHLGHFALVHHLWPALLAAGAARVVVVSSNVRPDTPIRWDDPFFRAEPYDRWAAYGQSKAANALFAAHLDTLGRPHGLRAVSLHPGAILTPLQRHMTRRQIVDAGWMAEDGTAAPGFKTVEQGAATPVWAAVTPDLGGVHCADCAVTPFRADPADAARLWAMSQDLLGLHRPGRGSGAETMSTRQTGGMESVWDYPRPPRAEASVRRIVVRHRGQVVADSTGAVRVLETSHPPVYYLPRADVLARLVPSRRRTFCEFKGVAAYWDLDVDGTVVPDAAWEYPDPTAGYELLKDRLAFYPGKVDECTVDGERVLAQPGDFYGGWITADITGPVKGGPGTQGW